MGLSYVQYAYKNNDSDGTKNDKLEVIASGVRGRLFSVWWTPWGQDGNSTSATQFSLLNASSSDVIFEYRVNGNTFRTGGQNGMGIPPLTIPSHGVLFTDGVSVQDAAEGLRSVTLTYSGE